MYYINTDKKRASIIADNLFCDTNFMISVSFGSESLLLLIVGGVCYW